MERRLILAIELVFISMLVPVPLLFALPAAAVRQVGLALVIAAPMSALFLPAISEPLFNVRYFEALKSEGWLLPTEQEYIGELSRYLGAYGEDGRIPGGLRWAAGYLILFIAMYFVSFVSAVTLYPAAGG